jgi:hypothetical protein
MKLTKLYPSISDDQKDFVRVNDYGGLLDIKCSKLQSELCQYVMNSFDPESCQLVFPGRRAIPVSNQAVHKILGVPMGDVELLFKNGPTTTDFMRAQFSIQKGKKQPTVASLEVKLASMRPANSKFLRFFIIYGMCSVLAPMRGVRISPRLYPSLVNIKEAKNLNMCRFVINILCKSLNQSGEREKVQPSMLFLMVISLLLFSNKYYHISLFH